MALNLAKLTFTKRLNYKGLVVNEEELLMLKHFVPRS